MEHGLFTFFFWHVLGLIGGLFILGGGFYLLMTVQLLIAGVKEKQSRKTRSVYLGLLISIAFICTGVWFLSYVFPFLTFARF